MTKPKFGDVPENTIIVGRTTTVLGERFRTLPVNQALPAAVKAKWWQRTDYAWACGVCPPMSGAMYKSLASAMRSAENHALEHRACTVLVREV